MDEMGVGIDYHRQFFWIKPGEVRPVRESHPTKLRLNVWGAIWYDGKTTLHVTKENFDQDFIPSQFSKSISLQNYHWVGNALSRIVYHMALDKGGIGLV